MTPAALAGKIVVGWILGLVALVALLYWLTPSETDDADSWPPDWPTWQDDE